MSGENIGENIIEAILSNPSFAPYIVENRLIPRIEARFADFPKNLDGNLCKLLRNNGIEKIYTHQAECFEQIIRGKNVVVVTPTASGKTLCYNLPVLQKLLTDETSRALFLFPTKALAQDQMAGLNKLFSDKDSGERILSSVKTSTYDGDTPEDLRSGARNFARIIISNPDMLHQGIMPNHTKWIKFFSNLRYVVIDESHTYRGVFGSHVANVIRRLKRIAAFYGSHPQFILCSATIANPKEAAELLINEEVVLIDNSGAPQGEKRIVLYNPPLVDPVQGIRRSSLNESRRWMLAFLQAGIKTILFAHSRIKTEIAARYVRDDLKNINTDNARIKIESYRGGLLPNERHEIERGLREGTVHGVVSTNALELGIDIGDLDASIVCGFPGSIASFRQQSGRAGRRSGASVSVFIATSSALDQFIIQNPNWFFNKSPEEARLDSNNPYIYTDHIKCACFELPFKEGADDPFGSSSADALSMLEEEGIVRKSSTSWYWASQSYPAEGISLRSATADNVVIVDTTNGKNTVIGEMDRPSAKEMLFKNAVYIHRGNQFLVTDLDIQNRKAFVKEAEVNYFTDGLVKTDIQILLEDDELPVNNIPVTAVLCDVLVRTQVTKFKKLKFNTHENIGFGEIHLPEEEMQTRSLAILFKTTTKLSTFSPEEAAEILFGIGTLIKQTAPVYLLCDARDLGIACRILDPHFEYPALFIYDKYPGGTGLSEALSGKIERIISGICKTVSNCLCKNGCPSCVGAGGNKSGVMEVLNELLP
ncbi:MAG: DEAD/DEAH box helicase [Spirochaetaceae bacterium]|jgi:DEAD/DEAH box helicase domain-containing protein|nr:DEAD/DEAH box helicase [Spirochaetaceae bacterium]